MSKDNYINTDQIKDFVKTNPDYYISAFEKINNAHIAYSENKRALALLFSFNPFSPHPGTSIDFHTCEP